MTITAQLAVRVRADVLRELERRAEVEEISVSALVRRAIRRLLSEPAEEKSP